MLKKIFIVCITAILMCGCDNKITQDNSIDSNINNSQIEKKGLKCTSDVEHQYGQMFINGQYLYIYLNNDNQDGWSVILDDTNSEEPVTSQICETVDDLPILTTESMFANSKTTSVDISSLNTSNVTSMKSMFENTKITNIIGLDKLNTSKVTNMSYMFSNTKLGNYDVKNFDTSNVTNMNYMFYMTNGKDYHIENFKFNEGLQAYGMFDENDNGKPNVYVNTQDRDKWNNLLGIETK